MNLWNQFLWVIFPYLMFTIFFVGHFYRFNTDQYGWTAKSSEILEKRGLKWGSLLFHWGIIFVFFGHVAGILVPKWVYSVIGVSEEMYHIGAVWVGGFVGIVTMIGILLLLGRRLAVGRIYVNSSTSDIVTVVSLVIVMGLGLGTTMGYTALGGEFDYRETIGPWFRSLFVFSPQPELMAGAPLIFQLHILAAFALFGIWPFTRLVHVWSLPLTYLRRSYVVYRSLNPKKALQAQSVRRQE
ncbi:respiratory nitrate reductase subunit gamma [Microaerobacter geothermalis]|uniref:respiratory nitrate reductase subunit gamma n=1 Tax=Microaerobacter geothermalis TaxID=674972 RepID=UPI001F43DC62|nr:respiratory nitrate reductase subunit gamma [Microaerobacter geothermalis]MCF6094463.1 respiratory nitrate reductase subunit gamma [Microaerobacter geothermalis]